MKPYVTLEWNDTKSEAKGWLCIFNLVKGYGGGGIRMHPTVTKEEVIRLATAMGYKRSASRNNEMGGCKAGIAYDYKGKDAYDVLKRFITAMRPYIDLGLSMGSDLGTKYEDVYKIYDELGMGRPMTKSMKNNPKIVEGKNNVSKLLNEKVDVFLLNYATTGYGVAFSADEAWKQKKGQPGAKVVIQGFGAVGASCAYKMAKMGYKVVGISDANCLVSCDEGLDVIQLIKDAKPRGEMNQDKFDTKYKISKNIEWLDIECDILIPAALEDVINESNANKVKASLIVEAANIPISTEGDEIIKKRKIDVVPDFISNIGAVRFYYSVTFNKVKTSATSVIDDIEKVCRENVSNLFKEAKITNKYQRDIAMALFEPTIQDDPEF